MSARRRLLSTQTTALTILKPCIGFALREIGMNLRCQSVRGGPSRHILRLGVLGGASCAGTCRSGEASGFLSEPEVSKKYRHDDYDPMM
jgi:hypothetical protein